VKNCKAGKTNNFNKFCSGTLRSRARERKKHSTSSRHCVLTQRAHRRSQGGQRGHAPQKFLENIVILFFKRRFSKQNSVICLKSNIFATPNFWVDYDTERVN